MRNGASKCLVKGVQESLKICKFSKLNFTYVVSPSTKNSLEIENPFFRWKKLEIENSSSGPQRDSYLDEYKKYSV